MSEDKDKETSEIKAMVNRQNALVSTGPRTPEGKAASSMNALKHGILSKELVITDGDGREPEGVFNEIQQACYEYYQPVGPIESLLLDRIVSCFWRLRRVIAFETGSIRAELDSITFKRKFEREDAYGISRYTSRKTGLDNDYRTHINSSSLGVKHVIARLVSVKQKAEKGDEINEEEAIEIIDSCGHFYERMPGAALDVAMNLAEDNVRGIVMSGKPIRQFLIEKGLIDKRTKSPQKIVNAMKVYCLDVAISAVKNQLDQVKKKEAMSDQAAKLAANLPDQSAIDKICRYEAHLERQLFKAMDQLEKLQRTRLGHHVPPPLNLDLRVENVTIRTGGKCETKPIDNEDQFK